MTATNALPLASLAEIMQGFSFRTRLDPHDDGIFVVQLADLEGPCLNTASLLRVHVDSRIPSHLFLQPGDVLLRTRGQPEAVLVETLPDMPVPVIAVAPLLILRPRTFSSCGDFGTLPPTTPGLYSPYLQWFLNHPQIVASLSARHTGSRGSILRKSVVSSLYIPLPPWKVQEQIVRIFARLMEEQRVMQKMMELRYRYVNSLLLEHAGGIDTSFYEASLDSPLSEALKTYMQQARPDALSEQREASGRRVPVPQELCRETPGEEYTEMCAWLQEVALASRMARRPAPEILQPAPDTSEAAQHNRNVEWAKLL